MKCVKLKWSKLHRLNWKFENGNKTQRNTNLEIAWGEKWRSERNLNKIQWNENAMYSIWDKEQCPFWVTANGRSRLKSTANSKFSFWKFSSQTVNLSITKFKSRITKKIWIGKIFIWKIKVRIFIPIKSNTKLKYRFKLDVNRNWNSQCSTWSNFTIEIWNRE